MCKNVGRPKLCAAARRARAKQSIFIWNGPRGNFGPSRSFFFSPFSSFPPPPLSRTYVQPARGVTCESGAAQLRQQQY